jgi:hypothetical protein
MTNFLGGSGIPTGGHYFSGVGAVHEQRLQPLRYDLRLTEQAVRLRNWLSSTRAISLLGFAPNCTFLTSAVGAAQFSPAPGLGSLVAHNQSAVGAAHGRL